LFDHEFARKQAATAFQSIAGLMSTCDTYKFTANAAQNTVTAEFNYDRRASYVLWTYDPGRHVEVCLATSHLRPIELKDVSGNSLPLQACGSNSQVKLELSERAGPLILEAGSDSSK
jgi:hypothetical protein